MASTLLADNGISSGAAGLKSSADGTGVLALQTTTAGGAVTTAVTIDNSQNVGVGVTSPASRVDVLSASTGVVKFTSGKSGWLYADSAGIALSDTADFTKNGLYINNTSNYVAVYTGSTGAERARIDSSGNLLVGTTSTNPTTGTATGVAIQSTGYIFASVAGDAVSVLNRSGGVGSIQVFKYAGTQVGTVSVTGSATAYNTSSDYRLKENISPMTGALEKVALLKPVTYTWKTDGSDGQGFIAHELAEVCPDAVVGEKDAVNADGSIKSQGIDTSFLVATLTAAIQELKAELDAAKADIATLKGAA